MSWQPCDDATTQGEEQNAVEFVVVPRTRDIGDSFSVARALPSRERRIVGPFIAGELAAFRNESEWIPLPDTAGP